MYETLAAVDILEYNSFISPEDRNECRKSPCGCLETAWRIQKEIKFKKSSVAFIVGCKLSVVG